MKKLIIPLLFSQIFNPLAFASEQKTSYSDIAQYRNIANAAEISWLESARNNVKKQLNEKHSYIQEKLAEKKNEVAKKIKKAKKDLSEQATEAIRNASVSYSFEIPSLKLGIIDFSPLQIETSSEMKYPNRWSRVDVWESSLGFPVGMKYISLGGNIKRKITYVRMFDNQEDSVNPDKLLYNPFDKIPLNAEEALTNLKEGEIIGYQAPFTISLSTDELKKYVEQIGSFGINAFDKQSITTDVEFQIQRLANNHFRVRAYTSRGVNNTFTIKAFIGGLNGALLRILSLHPLDIFFSHDHTGLYATDLVFNLNTEGGKKTFSDLVSTNFDIQKKINLAQLFIKDKTDLKKIVKAELDSINKLIREEDEAQIKLEDKSVIKIAAHTMDSTTNTTRWLSNFFQLFKVKFTSSEQKSYVLIDKEKTTDSEPTSFLFFKNADDYMYTAAKLWKGGSRDYLGLLIETNNDEERKPIKALGLQTFKQRQENQMSPQEYLDLQKRLAQSLPAVVMSDLKFPKVSTDMNSVRTQQTLFLKSEAVDVLKTIPSSIFLKRINELLAWHSQNNIKIKAMPEELKNAIRAAPMGQVPEAATYAKEIENALSTNGNKKADYVKAFENDANKLSNEFAEIFNPSLNPEETVQKLISVYTEKLRDNDFFKALGIRTLLRAIPQDKVKDAVAFEFVLTGRDMTAIKTTYPQGVDMNVSNTFNSFINETESLNVRNYELNTFFNFETGSIKTVDELLKGK